MTRCSLRFLELYRGNLLTKIHNAHMLGITEQELKYLHAADLEIMAYFLWLRNSK